MTTQKRQMLAGWTCGVLLTLAVASCSTPSGSKTSLKLFNGKDLNGWTYVSADPKVPLDQVWSVKEGILTCQGTPVGFIYSGPNVTNFRMSVEYRWPAGGKPGNSGIFSRLTPAAKGIPTTVEVQLKHGNAGDLMGLQGRQLAAGQPRFFEVKAHPVAGDIAGVRQLANLEKPVGEWNKVEILAQGSHYTVWLNGKLANEAEGVEVVSGPVGLQSEDNIVQFRNVKLTPLD
jgi:hypothetical protein